MSKFQLARFLILPLLDIFVLLVVMMQAVVQAFLHLASHMDRRPGGLYLLQSALKVCSSAQVVPNACAWTPVADWGWGRVRQAQHSTSVLRKQ
jgi:hypothetical protein